MAEAFYAGVDLAILYFTLLTQFFSQVSPSFPIFKDSLKAPAHFHKESLHF